MFVGNGEDDDNEIHQWKEYLFDHRGKIMFERLNGMIEAGVKDMRKKTRNWGEEEEMREEPQSEEREVEK